MSFKHSSTVAMVCITTDLNVAK